MTGTPSFCFIFQPASEPEKVDEHGVGYKTKRNALEGENSKSAAVPTTPLKNTAEGKDLHHSNLDGEEELDESFWEDGSLHTLNSVEDHKNDLFNGMTIEFDGTPDSGTPDSGKRKTIRRASAEDKVNCG